MPINKPHHRPCHTEHTKPSLLPSPLPPQTSRATTTRAPELRNSTAAATSSTTTTKVGDAPQLHCRFCSAQLCSIHARISNGDNAPLFPWLSWRRHWRIACVFFFCREMDASFLFVRFCGLLCFSNAWCIRRFVNASETTARFLDAPVIVQL